MIPLLTRSHFSLMWGTCSPKALCRAAREMGYTRLALTDTDGLYGLPEFLKACKNEGIGPIIGAELTDPGSHRRAVCLVESHEGYRNLCRLLTARLAMKHAGSNLAESSLGSIVFSELLATHARGLVLLTSDPDLLLTLHASGATVAGHIPRRPAGRFYRIRQAADRAGVEVAVTPGSFFVKPDDYATHRVLRAIANNTSLSRLGPLDVAPADAWLAPPEVYRRRFDVFPEGLKATRAIADRCAFTGPEAGTIFPRIAWGDNGVQLAPLTSAATKYHTHAHILRERAYTGAKSRYGEDLSEAVVERLEHELRRIEEKGFSDYFLVVEDIIRRSPRICGRGSGAASIVAYSLGITNVCPIKFNLYFERFLNPGRVDPPDIDVDFAWDERDDVLASVLTQYAGHSAMVCNHVTFKPRMAIHEVAKVMGLPESEIGRVGDRFAWRVERWDGQSADAQEPFPLWTKQTRGGQEPDQWPVASQGATSAQGATGLDAPWPEILEIANRLVGIPRHLSVHPGGLIITPRPISEYVPVERAPKGVPIIHWEKDGSEEMGLVKIDLLGNRSLGVIRDAIAQVRANGIDFDEGRWEPEDDPATQQAIARGETMGCFYIESPGMRLLQQKTRKGDYEHLIIQSSIIRPAANEYIRAYVSRVRGAEWKHLHPLLADVLEETYGIMVYQEQVSLTAMALAGFSHSEADRLRKVLSKKDKEKQLADYRQRFFLGGEGRGISPSCLQAVWDMMMSFAGYSFCKPHSASYARVSFQAAYLKVHHPAEFMAGVISNQGGFYSTFAYVSEARRLGVQVLHADVNRSEIRWRGQGQSMRVGLLSIKALSTDTCDRMLAERARRPFGSLNDFLIRISPDEREARALIHAGACDQLEPGRDRVELLWELARWHYQRTRTRTRRNARTLFDDPDDDKDVPFAAPVLAPTDELQALRNEYAVLGFLCDRHPMVLFNDVRDSSRNGDDERSGRSGPVQTLLGRPVVKATALKQHIGRRVQIAGWLITGKVVTTKHGDPMEFLTFEDESGLIETTFFPEIYRRSRHLLVTGGPYFVRGLVEEEFGAVTLTAEHLEKVRATTGTRFKQAPSVNDSRVPPGRPTTRPKAQPGLPSEA